VAFLFTNATKIGGGAWENESNDTSLDLSLGLGAHNKGGETNNSTPQNLLFSCVGTELLARLGDWPLRTIENILIGTIWRLKSGVDGFSFIDHLVVGHANIETCNQLENQ
jgi:hypothetical protein